MHFIVGDWWRSPYSLLAIKRNSTAKSERVKIEYQQTFNTKTALAACNLLTEHLLDALEDLSDFSSFDHAETFAEQIKDAIDNKIAAMQGQEETEEEEEQEREKEPA